MVLTINQLCTTFAGDMYFRSSIRPNPATGQLDSYYRLVESYRNETDRVCHRPLLTVGFLGGQINADELNQVRRIICKRYQALEQLQLPDFLSNIGFSEEEAQLAVTQIISRAVYPASELETARWIRENSGVCQITGYPIEKTTKDKLYKGSLKLFSEKEKIEE